MWSQIQNPAALWAISRPDAFSLGFFPPSFPSFKPSIPKGRGLPLPLSLPGDPKDLGNSSRADPFGPKCHSGAHPKNASQKDTQNDAKNIQNEPKKLPKSIPNGVWKGASEKHQKSVEKVTPQNLENMVFALEGLQKSKNSPLQKYIKKYTKKSSKIDPKSVKNNKKM